MTVEQHVLIVPNMTYSRGGSFVPESDSFVADLRALLPRLRAARPQLRFTLLTPKWVTSLAEHCQMLEWPLPTYNNTMRCHFDALRLLKLLDAKHRSWDAVWSHLPEQTLAVQNVIYNGTDERPALFGYSHWAEIPELNSFTADTFVAWLNGALVMQSVGVTTVAMRDTLMRHAAQHLSRARLEALASIVRPMYLGTDQPAEYLRHQPEPGLLIWNHRVNSYTGWPLVLAELDKLWCLRQDFRVVCTLADVATNRPYMTPARLPAAGTPKYREAYFSLLTRGWAGLPRLSSHWTWPVAVADGMSAGLPYVVPRGFYTTECLSADYRFAYDEADGALANTLNTVLDAGDARAVAVEQSVTAAKCTSWDERITPFIQQFDVALGSVKPVGNSPGYRSVLSLVRERRMSKRDILKAMDWHGSFPFTPYRRRLALDGVSMTATHYWCAD